MATPYVGEIKMFAGNFAPRGWMFCEGQVLPIQGDGETLFQLIGTTYGGDGVTTFALPDLRGRLPVHMGTAGGTTFQLGEMGGVETATLTVSQMPAHSHAFVASSNNASTANASGNVLAQTPTHTPYISGAAANAPLAANAVSTIGGSQPHNNLQPYLCVDFIISIFGLYPNQ
jgi:microcystin-dependent protein